MISAASSQRAVLLCLLQSLAGVIFGWSNAEGSGLVSFLPRDASDESVGVEMFTDTD